MTGSTQLPDCFSWIRSPFPAQSVTAQDGNGSHSTPGLQKEEGTGLSLEQKLLRGRGFGLPCAPTHPMPRTAAGTQWALGAVGWMNEPQHLDSSLAK